VHARGRILGRRECPQHSGKPEEGRGKVGKDALRIRSNEKKTKQSRDRFTFNVQHKFGTRTLIGAPKEKEGRDGPIRSFDETRVRRTLNEHRSDLPLFGEEVGVGDNQVVVDGLGG
jgi:hypothetical protein